MNTQNFKVNSLQTAMFAAISALSFATASHALEKLDDNALANVTGKELAQFTTIKPGELGNPNGDVGFYRLALNAKMELNANMDKLRLGCDNADGTDCDISIDKVVMSGIVPSKRITGANDFPYYGSVSQKLTSTKKLDSGFSQPENVGPGTDFVMNKPFVELAIKNPNSLTDRKLVGYRFGAHEVWGAMSTGDGPRDADGNAPDPILYGPIDASQPFSESNVDLNNPIGSGEGALDVLWKQICSQCNSGNAFSYPDQPENFKKFKEYVNYSVERGHTGVNTISGRLPVRIDNLNVSARVYRALVLGIPIDTRAETAVVSGRLSRLDTSDFGRIRNGGANANGAYESGYLRNVFVGDSDTTYRTSTHGNYVANDDRAGRAPTFKRASRAQLNGMIVHVHGTVLGPLTDGILGGDRFNDQSIATKTFHQLVFGEGNTYSPENSAKHFAFQYQTQDGLQWITTDKRLASRYDGNGNPDPTQAGFQYYGGVNGDQQGYDWLSTRAGWWLESPMASVKNAYIRPGQTPSYGAPGANDVIKLKSLDLGARPIDNCYGNLVFC